MPFKAKDFVSITTDKTSKLLNGLAMLAETSVLAGIPKAENSRKAADSPLGNAALGYIHEHGEPAANIPERPFLVPGIKSVQPQITERFKVLALAALDGKPKEALLRQYNAVGLIAQNAIRRKIQQGPFAPLAESTLVARRARGRTGARPLIDTGQLRNSITYVLRKNA